MQNSLSIRAAAMRAKVSNSPDDRPVCSARGQVSPAASDVQQTADHQIAEKPPEKAFPAHWLDINPFGKSAGGFCHGLGRRYAAGLSQHVLRRDRFEAAPGDRRAEQADHDE